MQESVRSSILFRPIVLPSVPGLRLLIVGAAFALFVGWVYWHHRTPTIDLIGNLAAQAMSERVAAAERQPGVTAAFGCFDTPHIERVDGVYVATVISHLNLEHADGPPVRTMMTDTYEWDGTHWQSRRSDCDKPFSAVEVADPRATTGPADDCP